MSRERRRAHVVAASGAEHARATGLAEPDCFTERARGAWREPQFLGGGREAPHLVSGAAHVDADVRGGRAGERLYGR